jgi:hypothetical protein
MAIPAPSPANPTLYQIPVEQKRRDVCPRAELRALYKRCKQIGAGANSSTCGKCGTRFNLAFCLDCSKSFCDRWVHDGAKNCPHSRILKLVFGTYWFHTSSTWKHIDIFFKHIRFVLKRLLSSGGVENLQSRSLDTAFTGKFISPSALFLQDAAGSKQNTSSFANFAVACCTSTSSKLVFMYLCRTSSLNNFVIITSCFLYWIQTTSELLFGI